MIDFIEKQFGVEATKLSYAQVEEFFKTPRKESLHLEFKSFDGGNNLPEKIYKSACAMLNSDGGLIIWGAPKEKKVESKKECSGQLTPLTNELTKVDLTRSLSDKVTPIPNGIQVFPLNDGDNWIYLFQIQKSEYSPHQTGDKYYMRLDEETRVAPHYYIDSLFKQIRYPDLRGRILFQCIEFTKADYSHIVIDFTVTIKNNSPLQNEEFPKIILSSNEGTLLEGHEDWPKGKAYPILPHRPDPMEVLYYGKKIERRYRVGFITQSLMHIKGKANIILRFGGRFAPLKYSFYELDLSFFDRMKYNEMQRYPIPDENIKALEDKLVADAKFDMDEISAWNTLIG